MEENNKVQTPEGIGNAGNEELSFFNFRTLFQTFILNWQWFALSLIISLGLTAIYLRYTTPRYQSSAKLLIKDEEKASAEQAKAKAVLDLVEKKDKELNMRIWGEDKEDKPIDVNDTESGDEDEE